MAYLFQNLDGEAQKAVQSLSVWCPYLTTSLGRAVNNLDVFKVKFVIVLYGMLG